MKLISISLFIFITMQVNAHESDDWCPDNQIRPIVNISIPKLDLQALTTEQGVFCSIPVIDPSILVWGTSHREIIEYISLVYFDPARPQHGMEDDYDIEYRSALAHAYCTCSILNGEQYIDPRVVRPILLTDTAASENHHDEYQNNDGISFDCFVCRNPMIPVPIPIYD